MHSDATTVEEYLDGLDSDRRAQIEPVYRLVRDAMPDGYAESVGWGMISWSVPLERFTDTYNGKPLAYVCLAAQKHHNALYLMGLYSDSQEAEAFRTRWTADGRRLDMGKSCLRYKDPAEINEDLITETVAGMPPERLIALHERARAERPVRAQAKQR